MALDLPSILNSAQGGAIGDWRLIPGGEPGTDLLVGLVDAGTVGEPALTALEHNYRAVYLPDARLGLGWGMTSEEWPSGEPDAQPEWVAPEWTGVEPKWAHVLLNGVMVWRVRYAYVNRGAAMDGILPWPRIEHEQQPTEDLDFPRAGWATTQWEVEFARLLNALSPNCDEGWFDDALRGFGLLVREIPPTNSTT